MKLSSVVACALVALGLCVGALSARAETEADTPELSPISIFAVTAAAFADLSDMPIARADLGLVWVDISEGNLEFIARQMSEAKIPNEFNGGFFKVIWLADCRFSIDASLIVPRLDVASNFSDDEKLVAQYLIEVVLREQLATMKNWISSIDFVKIASCNDRPVAFEAYQKDMYSQANAITRAMYQVGGKLALDALAVIQDQVK